MPDSPENKVSKVLRVLLSFILFVLVVVISLAVCTKTVLLNKSSIEDRFTGYEYVSSVKDSVVEYASDIYLQNGLDSDNLDDIFDEALIRDAIKAYVANNIGSEAGYNETTYTEPVNSICTALETDITNQIAQKGLEDNTDSVSSISESVNNYMLNEIDIGYSNTKTLLNVGSIAATVILCVGLFFALAAGLILFFIGSVRYRSIRAVGISFYAAGFYEIMISIMVCIIFRIKHIDIFPVYLKTLVMDYIYSFAGSVAAAGFISLIAALIISVAVWKVKRGK